MPSDKCDSIMAKATGLISSLFNVASSQNVPFYRPQQQLQCLHHGSTKVNLCSPLSLHYRVGDDLQYAHYGFSASLRYISAELAGALLTLFKFFANKKFFALKVNIMDRFYCRYISISILISYFPQWYQV